MKPRCVLTILSFALSVTADDGGRLLRLDHYVQVRSAVPAIAGQSTQVYVREVVEAATVLRGGPAQDRVALFIHGAGTPAEVAFDVPYQDYSWMAYLAHAGFGVFSMDMTGYGRSARPAAMNDPCNLARAQQAAYVPMLIPTLCDPSYPHQMTTLASDWQDIDGVVNHVRALRHVDKLNLLAWSLGGQRSAGYAAQHADKVLKLVLLAHDKQVNPDRVRELYEDWGSPKKVFVDLACSSHNAMWEKNHLLLFKASLEWLAHGTVEGKREGLQRLGY
jgi:pimeloyl-ACP methyl ester carboxylesterase